MEEIQRIGELEKIPEIVVSAGKTLEKTEKTKSRPFTVIVEGNIGSGKTTFLQVCVFLSVPYFHIRFIILLSAFLRQIYKSP